MKNFIITLLILVFVINNSKAQLGKSPYLYPQLSSFHYKNVKDSIKKNINHPVVYSVKETQKKFNELWEERLKSVVSSIEKNEFLYDEDIAQLLNEIVAKLAQGNSEMIKDKPLVFVNRSSVVNAYSLGLNIIIVNLGILDFVKSKEELSFILAHELAHNYLEHSTEAMKQYAEWITSNEYKSTINDLEKMKFGKLSYLKKISSAIAFDKKRHSRFKETEADSLAVVMLKNAKMPFNASWLLRLDSADIVYKSPLPKDITNFWADYNLPIDPSLHQKKGGGLSTKAYNFKDTTTLADSLKTHPECIDRFKKNEQFTSKNFQETPINSQLKQKIKKAIIWNLFTDASLTACMYRLLIEKENTKDYWYDMMVYNTFFGLIHSTNNFKRFKAIDVLQKEFISKDYYRLQTMLEQIAVEDLQKCYNILKNAPFWNNIEIEARELMPIYDGVINNVESTKQLNEKINNYLKNYNTSMFCELLNYLKK